MQPDDQRASTRGEAAADLMRAEHARLDALLAGIPDEQFIQPGAFGEWSVKDMLAHITFWEQRLIAYLNGARESLIQPGEDEQAGIDRINAGVLVANRDRPLADVRESFASSYQQTLALVESLGDDALAQEQLFGLIAGDTFGHYREHIKMLEDWQKRGA
ncbi:MAG TPA: maleylpyruvate isomerase N-terminal domain-containing protein [Ktedonobacterales bacterium]|nr:maleylpyruvate isomerase N-terminal domain-containing protein [Ktedonobacterales bacterium]